MSQDQTANARRTRILETATTMFSRYGFRRTSMDAIAAEVPVSKATLYAYFSSKSELFTAVTQHVCTHFLQEATRAANRDVPFVDRLVALLEAKHTRLFALVHNTPHAVEIIQSKNKHATEIVEQSDAAYRDILLSLLRAHYSAPPASSHTETLEDLADVLHWCALGITHSAPDVPTHQQRLRKAVLTLFRPF